jgi:DNA-binding MarR family transcriptional regulator
LKKTGLELLSPFLYTFRVSSKKNVLREEAERVADTCYVIRLRVFNRLISRVYNEALSARALTVSQFNILTVIVRREPVAPHQISAVLQIEKSSLSRNIDLMRRKGWIITKSTGRRSLISVTEKGRNVYKTALPSWKDAQQKALTLTGKEIFQQITATVRSLRNK